MRLYSPLVSIIRLFGFFERSLGGWQTHYIINKQLICKCNAMNYNGLNNSNTVNNANYREKICEFKFLLDQLTSFMDDMVNNKQNGLPDDIPTTVCGTEGVMKVLQCGRSKATDIMNDPKYQSAFFGGKGTRKRLCDTRVLLSLMRQGHE